MKTKMDAKTALEEIIMEFQDLQEAWDGLEKPSDREKAKRREWLSERRLAIFKALDQLDIITKILQNSTISLYVDKKSAYLAIPFASYTYTADNIACPAVKYYSAELISNANGVVDESDLINFKTWLNDIYSRFPLRNGKDVVRWVQVTDGDY